MSGDAWVTLAVFAFLIGALLVGYLIGFEAGKEAGAADARRDTAMARRVAPK